MDIQLNPSIVSVMAKDPLWSSSRVSEAGSLEALPLNPGVAIVRSFLFSFWFLATKYDPTAFLFTLKNPHFTEPLRLKKKKNMKNSIFSTPNCGPIFGSQFNANLYISNNCSMINNSYIYCDKDSEYEYNQTYQSSLFVNSNEMQSTNRFTVLDYEVYLMNM